MQTVFILRRSNRGFFGRYEHKYLNLPQHFCFFSVSNLSNTRQHRLQQRIFAANLFQFHDLKSEQRLTLQEEVSFSKKTGCVGWQFARFSQNVWPGKQEFTYSIIDTQKWDWICRKKNKLFTLYFKDIIEHPNSKLVYRSDFVISIESLSHTLINSHLLKFSNSTIAKFTTSLKTNSTLLAIKNYLKKLTMCSTLDSDWPFSNSVINLGMCTVRMKWILGNFVCTKWFLNNSREIIINMLNARPYLRSVSFPLGKKFVFIFLSEGCSFLNGNNNQLKMELEKSFDLADFAPTEVNEEFSTLN